MLNDEIDEPFRCWLLAAFQSHGRSIDSAALGAKIGLTPPELHRVMHGLRLANLIEEDERHLFSLTPEGRELASTLQAGGLA